MGRKKRCPECGSKKVDFFSIPKRCGTCGFTWAGKEKTRDAKKDKVRF
jgi:ribosomal protein L37AE/L43A